MFLASKIYSIKVEHFSDWSKYVRSLTFDRSKPKIECSSLLQKDEHVRVLSMLEKPFSNLFVKQPIRFEVPCLMVQRQK